ncbi:serine/threonine protein kinase, partial [bacterium]|nr:serine/threonine protein kinase [bacterium]
MKESDRIGPYTLIRQLGRGVAASTWLAEQAIPAGAGAAGATVPDAGAASEEPGVVLKILDLSEASSWGTVDLFRREADALKALSHPGIPAYLGSFEDEEGGRLRLVLAMEHIEGVDLEKAAASGRRFSETEIEAILASLADILAYLGELRPPVVHRDVNPRNIILRPDGSIALVDFSGVQDAVRAALYPGATLVGTAGYIPLEQVAGKASPRSDLYGAAATAVFMLTGRNPSELPTSGLRINLAGLVELPPAMTAVLDSWLDPDVARRTLGPRDAALILRGLKQVPGIGRAGEPDDESRPARGASTGGKASLRDQLREAIAAGREPPPDYTRRGLATAGAPARLPADSKVVIEDSAGSLLIRFPRAKLGGAVAPGAGFAAVWIGFVAFWTFMTVKMRAPVFFSLFSLPFWGAGFFMLKAILGPVLARGELLIAGGEFVTRATFLGFERTGSWPIADIGAVCVVPSRLQVNGASQRELLIEAGTRQLRLGAGLSERELTYLAARLGEEI